MKKTTHPFIGRKHELNILTEEYQSDRPSLTLVYGRRRVGKTRLLNEFCAKKKHLRFEGLEKGSVQDQINNFIIQLASQTGKKILAQARLETWRDVFDLLNQEISAKRQIIVFDEFPWMIQKDPKEVALFKYYWDNFWSKNKKWMIILCGSVNTFMVKDLVFSSALYGRVHNEIHMEPFSIQETHEFFEKKKSAQELIETYLVFGGLPRYLEEIKVNQSVVQNIQKLCFTKDSFFTKEFNRLFHDEFEKTKTYITITKLLAQKGHLNYSQIVTNLGANIGGGYKEYLDNLEKACFIESYSPFSAKDNTSLIRYRIIDEYLLFYFHYIQPNIKQINQNTANNFFLNSVGKNSWASWSGFAFERFCLKHIQKIQQILNINQLVKNYGSLFKRKNSSNKGLQIDLLFERHDNVYTVCEIKYTSKPIGVNIINAVENKLSLLTLGKKQSIEKVLITASPPTQTLEEQHYFNHIISLNDFISNG